MDSVRKKRCKAVMAVAYVNYMQTVKNKQTHKPIKQKKHLTNKFSCNIFMLTDTLNPRAEPLVY